MFESILNKGLRGNGLSHLAAEEVCKDAPNGPIEHFQAWRSAKHYGKGNERQRLY